MQLSTSSVANNDDDDEQLSKDVCRICYNGYETSVDVNADFGFLPSNVIDEIFHSLRY